MLTNSNPNKIDKEWTINIKTSKTFRNIYTAGPHCSGCSFTKITRTIIVVIIAESTLTVIWNPGFNTILENIQTWTLLQILGQHCVPHYWSKTPKRPLTHFSCSCIRKEKFIPFFIVRENFLHKWRTKIILHLVHLCGQAVNITVVNTKRFIFF